MWVAGAIATFGLLLALGYVLWYAAAQSLNEADKDK